MTSLHPLRIPVADLLRRPGSARPLDVAAPLAGLTNEAVTVPETAPVQVSGTLERISDGIVVRATVTAPWAGACSRCLRPVAGELAVHVDELFEPHPVEGETYPLGEDAVDLEPLVRDAILLELPPAPLCGADCAGLCPVCGGDRNVTACDCGADSPDPRWAALRSLEI